jgi:hypothetical protein
MRKLHTTMLLISAATILACGSGGGKTTQPLGTLTVSPADAQTVFAGTQPNLTYTATLTDATDPITWTLSPASPDGGTLSGTTGATVTYNPPASVASDTSVTLKATAGALSASVTITVKVTPATPTLSVSPSPAGPFTVGGAGHTFTAVQLNASNPITWSLSQPVGSLSATSGATTVYTPPASVPQNTVVTLTATAGALTATSTFTVQPGTPSLTVSPTLNAAGNVAVTGATVFTATLLNSAATINWTLSPASGRGSLSAASGTTVTYTPPTVTGSVGGVTLTATAGTLTKTVPIVIDPAAGVASTTLKTLLQDFTVDNISGSVVAVGDATGAAAVHDTTAGHDLGATKVSFTSAIDGQFAGVVATLAQPADLSTADLLALDVGFDSTETFTRVQVLFWSSATDFFVAPNGGYMTTNAKPVRVAIPIKKSAMIIGNGSPSWSNVQKIEIRLVSVDGIGSNQSMYIYNVWRINAVKPSVLMTFNGSNISISEVAAPALAAAGFPATIYLGGNDVTSNATSQMSLAQVQALYAAGWDVGNLTIGNTPLTQMGSITCSAGVATFAASNVDDVLNVTVGGTVTFLGSEDAEYQGPQTVATTIAATATTPAAFTFNPSGGCGTSPAPGFTALPTLSSTAITQAVQQQQDWATTNGVTRGGVHFVYPQSYFDDNVISVLRARGMKTARTASKGPFEDYTLPTFTGILDPFHLPAVPVTVHVDAALPHNTAAAILAIVDAAVAKGCSIHLFVNNLVTSNPLSTEFLTSEFQALVTGLKTRSDAGAISVVTLSKWYAGQ